MGRTLNVLVLGVGGNVSQGIQKALSIASLPLRVLAACITADAPGLYLADRAYISPLAASDEFIPWLRETCLREGIDAIMSGSEQVLETLAPHASRLRAETEAVSIVSSEGVLDIGRDKLRTCHWLESEGLPVPGYAHFGDLAAVRRLVDRCGFPLIAKPRLGKGSDAILTIRDEQHLEEVVAATQMLLPHLVTDMVLQQHLGTARDEYTAGCFCDRDGVLHGTIVMRRRLHTGTTAAAELGEFPDVRAAAAAIASRLRALGPCNVQLRVHEGKAIAFEINPRFSGTSALRARMGFNEVEAALRHFVLGEPVSGLDGGGRGVALRYWNEVYVPADAMDALARERELTDPRALAVQVESWGSQS